MFIRNNYFLIVIRNVKLKVKKYLVFFEIYYNQKKTSLQIIFLWKIFQIINVCKLWTLWVHLNNISFKNFFCKNLH